MFDIDPPSPVLRLSAPRPAQQPTLKTDKQHLARLERFERRDPRDALVFRANGAIERFKALNEAEASLAREIASL